jgi:hypothetical protein
MSRVLSAITLLVGLAATYAFLFYVWPLATDRAAALVAPAGVTTSVHDTFVNIVGTIAVPQLPPLSLMGALTVAGVCAVVLLLGALLPGRQAPLRLWFSANVLVLLLTALWAFFAGNVAYDGATFMQLVSRTSLLMVLAAPIFAVIVAALLPFSFAERIAMFVMLVSLDFAIALVRLAAFPLLVARFGTLAEPNLYLFLGPLMDVVYFIVVYSGAVVALSRRLAGDEEAWEWL